MDWSKKEKIIPPKQCLSEDWTVSSNIGLKFLRNDCDGSENTATVCHYSDTKSFITLLNQQMCCQRLALACWYGPYYFLMYLIAGIMLLIMIIFDFSADNSTLSDRLWFRAIHLVVVVMLIIELLIRINAIWMGRIECLMDWLVIMLAVFILSLHWVPTDMSIVGEVDSPKETFLVARYIINILCMGYLFTKQLQRIFCNRVFKIGSYESDCHRHGLDDIQVRLSQAVSYNTFPSIWSHEENPVEEKLCFQQTKNLNSKNKHVRWGILENEMVKNYRPLKKAMRIVRVP